MSRSCRIVGNDITASSTPSGPVSHHLSQTTAIKMGDNPVVLELLAVVGRNPNVADPAKAKARLNAIMADKGHAHWKGNRLAVYELRLFHQLASPRNSK